MEALDALEALQEGGQALGGARRARDAASAAPSSATMVSVKTEGSKILRGAKRPATPPSAKCARRISGQGDKVDVKMETDGFAHGRLDCGDVGSDPEGERDVEDKPCSGCQRSKFRSLLVDR